MTLKLVSKVISYNPNVFNLAIQRIMGLKINNILSEEIKSNTDSPDHLNHGGDDQEIKN
jgi:hypothetical protein